MISLLLAVIYISFISLGLPDSVLGSVWPVMYGQLRVPVSYAGMVSMIIAGGTIVSSLNSDRVIRRFGTGVVTAVSVGMTAAALFGFSLSDSFWMLCLWAVPYGLGAGSVDAALNNFVALHYEAKHMSWLHCFWGIGATLGPYIMGFCLTRGLTWQGGYRTISILQIALTAVLIVSLPLWKYGGKGSPGGEEEPGKPASAQERRLSVRELLSMKGAKPALTAFLCYCALESAAGLWASSYMVLNRGMAEDTAAKRAAYFYLGITFGRFLGGFITTKLGDKNMVRLGQAVAGVGIAVLCIPGGTPVVAGLILVGLGCAPVYPSLLHETPENFGAGLSQQIMGMQMACAYVGSTFMPPLFGLIAGHNGIGLYPAFLAVFVVLMTVMTEKLHKR